MLFSTWQWPSGRGVSRLSRSQGSWRGHGGEAAGAGAAVLRGGSPGVLRAVAPWNGVVNHGGRCVFLMGFTDLLVIYGDLMGFTGNLMGFTGDLLVIYGDLMGFTGNLMAFDGVKSPPFFWG